MSLIEQQAKQLNDLCSRAYADPEAAWVELQAMPIPAELKCLWDASCQLVMHLKLCSKDKDFPSSAAMESRG